MDYLDSLLDHNDLPVFVSLAEEFVIIFFTNLLIFFISQTEFYALLIHNSSNSCNAFILLQINQETNNSLHTPTPYYMNIQLHR